MQTIARIAGACLALAGATAAVRAEDSGGYRFDPLMCFDLRAPAREAAPVTGRQ